MNHHYYQWPSYPFYEPFQPANRDQSLKYHTLSMLEPLVQYGLKEAQTTSMPHAMREVAAISYLIGKGYDPKTAYQMVESWEVNEMFYHR